LEGADVIEKESNAISSHTIQPFHPSNICHSSLVSMTLQTGLNEDDYDVNEMQMLQIMMQTDQSMMIKLPVHLEWCHSACCC
jgi:hypothetical protein